MNGMTMKMPKVRVFTDHLQHIASEVGSENVEPVDSFGGYVAVDKYAKDNLEKTQANIQWKQDLKPMIEEEVDED